MRKLESKVRVMKPNSVVRCSTYVIFAMLLWVAVGCDQRTRPAGPSDKIPTSGGALKPGVTTTQGGISSKAVIAGSGEQWSGPGVSWTVPQGWVQEPGSGMRFATLRKGSLEMSVTQLISSGVAQNVNRWRGQIGLQDAGPDEMEQIVETFSVSGSQASFVAMEGETQALIGGILPRGDQTWFFKVFGERSEVMKEASTVRSFMKSIQFQ